MSLYSSPFHGGIGRRIRNARVPLTAAGPDRAKRFSSARRILKFAALGTVAVGAAGLVFGACLIHRLESRLPSVANIAAVRQNAVTSIVSSDGVLLATLRTQNRRPVSLSQISPYLIDATIATEDRRFYAHSGVDYRGIARAFFSNLASGRVAGQGGSTLTQQLARTLYLSREKSLTRKVEEALLAQKIEQNYSKRQILEAYLNTVYYGSGCYGAQAAALTYFGKPASALMLGEAALLAGLPQRPGAFSPVDHLFAALKRRETVLQRMETAHNITIAQRLEAEAFVPHVFRPRLETMQDWRAPYFVAHVLSQLRTQYGPEFLYSGVRVETTLNWKMEQAAERALRSGIARGQGANTGAIVSIDPHNGYVRALVGGPDFRKDAYDAATQGARQPGSAFKPIVYATAFDTNVCTLATPIEDKKLVFPTRPKQWIVHNYENGYRGNVSVLEAIRQSINTVAVQVLDATSPMNVVDYGQRLGITTPLEPNLPLALGASAVHPIELCSAYSAFANGGQRYDPVFITRILSTSKQEIFADTPEQRYHANFFGGQSLDQVNVALREVVPTRPARRGRKAGCRGRRSG